MVAIFGIERYLCPREKLDRNRLSLDAWSVVQNIICHT
jgi:hypothetical protein